MLSTPGAAVEGSRKGVITLLYGPHGLEGGQEVLLLQPVPEVPRRGKGRLGWYMEVRMNDTQCIIPARVRSSVFVLRVSIS